MIKHTLSSVLLCAGLSCLAQHGPIGRAIKATQVVADPADMSYTTNTVVQEILEDIDDRFEDIDDRFGVTMRGTNIANSAYDPSTLTWGGLMKGTNIADSAYNPATLTWGGLMKGTNIANAAYDPATSTWGGLGNMPGTNIFFSSYSETNKTWTPVQYHADSYFFWAGNNGNSTKIITSGAAAAATSMHDYITATNIFSDAGGWMDLSTGVVTLPVAGLYDIRYSCTAVGAPVMLGYSLNGGPGAIPNAGGFGGWTSTAGKSVASLWAGYDAFQAGDELEFVYLPSVTLSSTVYVSQFFIYIRLVGPFPTGDFMNFNDFNQQ